MKIPSFSVVLFLLSKPANAKASPEPNEHRRNVADFLLRKSSSLSKPNHLGHKHSDRVLVLDKNQKRRSEMSIIRQVGDDIDDESYYGFSGTSVAMSADGQFLAVGAYGAYGYSGHVVTYRLDSSTQSWIQRGQNIVGEYGGDESGKSISLSHDGMRIAIGAPYNTGYYGHARVFEFDLETERWVQLGEDIDGEKRDGESGWSVALSGDGNRLAVGSPHDNTLSGHVKIYQLIDGGAWKQLGPTLAGDQYYTSMGSGLALSDNGNRIVIGSRFDFQNDVRLVGAVGVFEYVGGEWMQLGSELAGNAYYDLFGNSVDISGDGNRIVIATPNEDTEEMKNVGKVEVYEYNTVEKEWLPFGGIMMGDQAYQYLGQSVSMSGHGDRIVVGSGRCDEGATNAGCTWVFEHDPDTDAWLQIGKTIYGEFAGDKSGRAVAISADGGYFAVGAPHNEYYSGHTRVFKINDEVESSLSNAPSPVPSQTLLSSLSPSPTTATYEATSSPSQNVICDASHGLLEIKVITDANVAEETFFMVKKYDDADGKFSTKVMKRQNLESDTTMYYDQCLLLDACYIFAMVDRVMNGICCGGEKGRFKVTWDGNVIKRGIFRNGKTEDEKGEKGKGNVNNGKGEKGKGNLNNGKGENGKGNSQNGRLKLSPIFGDGCDDSMSYKLFSPGP